MIFFSQSTRACFSGIFQMLTTRAAPALAMAVRAEAEAAVGELTKSAENVFF
jgi:hypothetical protein